jgi:hypothetical protein
MKKIRDGNSCLRRGGCLLIFVFLFIFLALPLSATTYYVDNCVTVGSDSNNGTSTSTPWRTIAHVNAQSFNPGDSVLFECTCTWREELTVPSSGSTGTPITFGSYGTGAAPIISGANLLTSWPTSGSYYYASVSTQPHQVFRDGSRLTQVSSEGSLATGDWWWDSGSSSVYVYDNPSGHAIEASQRANAIQTGSGVQYVTLTKLHSTKANQFGIALNGGYITINRVTSDYNDINGILHWGSSSAISNGVTINNSTVAYNGGSGISFGFVDNWLIQGNNVHHNCWDPLQTSTRGIDGENPYTTNVTVEYNYVHENGYGQSGSVPGSGIACDTCGSGIVFGYNNVWGNNGYGIDIDADNNVTAYYNLSWNNANAGIIAFADANSSMTGIQLYNNTVYGNKSAGIWVEGPSAGSGPAGCTNNTIENNIVVGTVSGPNLKAFNGCENPGADGSGNVYTYNDFGAQAGNFIQWGASTYESTYSAWETATGNCGSSRCSHSIQTAPTFTNAGADNFTLASGSSAIDAGTNLGTTYQWGLAPSSSWPASVSTLNQNSYGSGWEIGAFVFVQSISPAPPTLLSVTGQ